MALVKHFTAPVVTVVTAGVPVQLSTTSRIVTDIIITADPDNTNYVYVGDSTVTAATGQPLLAGESFIISTPGVRGNQEDFDMSDVWVDAMDNGAIVRVSYVTRR